MSKNLSIITVNLNNRDGLKKTIDSVIAQTFKDFEWIVIDGGSTDGSRELLEEYSEHFAYWCSEPDNGIYNAMNKGVEHAKGEYCQFLNSGDWLAEETVLAEASKMMCGCDVLYGDIDFYKEGVLVKHSAYPDCLSFDNLYYGALGHNSCFIKTVLLREYPYDEGLKIVSDWKFLFQMFLLNKSFVHISKCIGCFDMSGISETHPDLHQLERKLATCDISSQIFPHLMPRVKKTETHLANLHLNEFNALCERHRFLSKCITAIVLLMKKFS